MAIFPLLEFEGSVQVGDKLRLDASRCFVSKGSEEIAALTIKPGSDLDAVSVYDVDASERYLDWVYEDFGIDVGASNADFVVIENDVEKTATVASGTYTLSTFITALQSALNDASDLTYALTASSDREVTIAATGAFAFKQGHLVKMLGFGEDTEEARTHTGDPVEYGLRIITVTATDGADPVASESKAFLLKVFSVDGDKLFSGDQDLLAHEHDILKYIPEGRSSFLNVHRRAQARILAWLDEKGYVNTYGDKFRKKDIINTGEVKEWSTFLSLKLIFESLSNAVDDVFGKKAGKYDALVRQARDRAILRIDVDRDGKQDKIEGPSIQSGSIFRR